MRFSSWLFPYRCVGITDSRVCRTVVSVRDVRCGTCLHHLSTTENSAIVLAYMAEGGVPIETLEKYARHSSSVVRWAVLERHSDDLSSSTMHSLAKDSDPNIRQLATQKNSLEGLLGGPVPDETNPI